MTSQLDAANERALKETVHTASKTRAVVVIFHRFSTVAGADNILPLEGGVISGRGTHEELLGTGPNHKKLVRT